MHIVLELLAPVTFGSCCSQWWTTTYKSHSSHILRTRKIGGDWKSHRFFLYVCWRSSNCTFHCGIICRRELYLIEDELITGFNIRSCLLSVYWYLFQGRQLYLIENESIAGYNIRSCLLSVYWYLFQGRQLYLIENESITGYDIRSCLLSVYWYLF